MPIPRVCESHAEPRIRYAYILGTSYSGSTLLSLLLDSHPRIVSIGELANGIHKFPGYKCSCGRATFDCEFLIGTRELCMREGLNLDLRNFRLRLGAGLGPFAQQLLFGSAVRAKWFELARDELLGHLPMYQQHVKQIFDRNSAIARNVIKLSRKDVFVDASKSVARVPHLLRRPDIDLHIIHIIRDARAVAWSAQKRKHKQGVNMARYWVRTHKRALEFAPLIGKDRYFQFRWEDFCQEPELVLNRICDFLDVEPVDLISRVNGQVHHVIGNNMRKRPVGHIRSDEGWRELLKPSQRNAVERQAAILASSFGYA